MQPTRVSIRQRAISSSRHHWFYAPAFCGRWPTFSTAFGRFGITDLQCHFTACMSQSPGKERCGCADQHHRYACLAWELVYWIVCASTTFERFGYGIWFVADLVHAAIVIRYQYADRKGQATREMCRGVGFFCVCFWTISIFNPDHESSAFFIGFVIQISVSYGSLYDIVWGEDMKGHSLEIWFVKPHASHSRGTQSLIRVTGALGL